MALPAALPALVAPAQSSPSEPDGSRTLGIVPPFRAEPAPPPWLRRVSHLLVPGPAHTRHYIYEAYADGQDGWLVRYIHLPEGTEAPPAREEAFLFRGDPLEPPRRLKAGTIRFESRQARWQGRAFVLVDRRDLVCAPLSPSPAGPRP